MKYLNLGCGRRFNDAWTNVNFISTGKGVIAHNLTKGIPFPDDSFDVVYHSHLLEHFTRSAAKDFLKECYRVLRPQGVLRVVVPDLEQIARTYIKALELANDGLQEWAANYEWISLELYDQVVRNSPGGEMAAYLKRGNIPNEEFIIDRMGTEAKNLLETGRKIREERESGSKNIKHLLKPVYKFVRSNGYGRDVLLRLILGQEYQALKVGRHRLSGENHMWMYDRYSLSVILGECGLKNILQRSATDSYIPNWASFNLDTEADGTIYKPDSLFMEGVKK